MEKGIATEDFQCLPECARGMQCHSDTPPIPYSPTHTLAHGKVAHHWHNIKNKYLLEHSFI